VNVDESTFMTATDEQQNLDQMGLYLQDQMSWNNWEWLVSGRYDWAKCAPRLYRQQLQQNDSKFTWRTGLLYAFDLACRRMSATAPRLNRTCKPTARRA
jgi:iron complex outermembrane receptor protein